jgi:rod shape-determining protein MreC
VHDKTVRRRRAVFALLVVLSLILISASFGSSGAGPLHAVQSGFLDVLSPIESGANKVLTPVHDLTNWIDDITSASSQRDKLQKQYDQVRSKYVAAQAQLREAHDLKYLANLDASAGLSADGPVSASVDTYPNSLLVQSVTIGVGTNSGVADNDPVINDAGLVGTVTSVAADASVVTLIDDNSALEPAIDNTSGEFGIVSADQGNPNLLALGKVTHPDRIAAGDYIVTAGGSLTDGVSFYPANIPIGVVTTAPTDTGNTGTITPAVDFGALGPLQVLTKVPR